MLRSTCDYKTSQVDLLAPHHAVGDTLEPEASDAAKVLKRRKTLTAKSAGQSTCVGSYQRKQEPLKQAGSCAKILGCVIALVASNSLPQTKTHKPLNT